MRVGIALLLVLFSMCGAQIRSTQTEVQTENQRTGDAATAAAVVTSQLDISAELRDMVEKLETMVVEPRTTLSFT